ncbi:MAG: SMC-Scp complex subunit ScpB [Dermatophilaceae bacterium]
MSEPTDAAQAATDGPHEPEPLTVASLPGGARAAVEAVLMVVDEPVAEMTLATALGLPVPDVLAILTDLEAEYAAAQRGFTVRNMGGGWRVYSRADYAPVVERFLLDGAQARLTQASLETLAVIAYRQPVSRGRIGAVRGVNVDGVVRTLVARGLVEEQGEGEGGAVLYGTTPYFLARLGINSLDELPPLAPFLPEAELLDEIAESARG